MNQIVLNLVINARDAMPDGGTATIDMGVIDLGEPVAPRLGILPGAVRRSQRAGTPARAYHRKSSGTCSSRSSRQSPPIRAQVSAFQSCMES